MDLFRSERYAKGTAMDIGAGKGSTAAALAVNFGVVLATEIYWMLAGATTGRGLRGQL